jgi:hypothetical protein
MISLRARKIPGETVRRRERGESGLGRRRYAPTVVASAIAAAAMMTATAISANAAPSAQASEVTSHVAAPALAAARPTGTPATPAVPLRPLARVNLKAAAAYAVKHVNDANQDYYNFSNNCANFVSSVLYWGGGDPMTYGHPYQPGNSTNDHNWYLIVSIRYILWSHSWSVAHDLYVHLVLLKSRRITDFKKAQPGDVIFANWDGKSPNGISHVGIITKMSKGEPYITQNTPNQVNISLNYWYKHGGRDVHVWIYQPNAD